MTSESMPATKQKSPQEHPKYTEGIACMAAGKWQQAIKEFESLQELYPKSVDVRELLDQVQMRATLAQSQSRRGSEKRNRRVTRWFVVGTFLMIIMAAAAIVAYEMWIDPVIIREFRLSRMTELRAKADEAIGTGNYTEARQALEELKTMLPEDPETRAALNRVEQLERMSELYGEVQTLMSAGEWDQALETLTVLQGWDAEYRDLPELLEVARQSRALDKQFQTAEAAFANGDWDTAIARYGALHQTNPTFRFEEIQTRLFESHLKYGQALIAGTETSSDKVNEALSHFSEALTYRPVDTEALTERRLAETYLAALDSENRDEMIESLLTIYDEQPDYAGQAATHLLYTALVERANALLVAGDNEAAITDYQIAAELPVTDPSEARKKLAELTADSTS